MVFKKGESGNPHGRPPGTRNKTTLAALSLIEDEGEHLTRKAIELALDGDLQALKLCMERLTPPAKERPLEAIKIPPLSDQRSVLKALDAIANKLSQGALLPTEASSICKVLEQYRKHFETTELTERLEALEKTLKVRK
jgi:hypothetical protein